MSTQLRDPKHVKGFTPCEGQDTHLHANGSITHDHIVEGFALVEQNDMLVAEVLYSPSTALFSGNNQKVFGAWAEVDNTLPVGSVLLQGTMIEEPGSRCLITID